MSIGRSQDEDADLIRDVNADYIKAYLEEYERFVLYKNDEMAEIVAGHLRALGHEVKPKKAAPTKETAVSQEPLEKAVEDAPKTRGRPRKTAE